MLMAQQLTGLFTSNWNHPDKSYPDSYFDMLTVALDANMYKIPTATPAQLATTPLTEVERAQAVVATHEKLLLEEIETIHLDPDCMTEIKEAVKAEFYTNLNTEALENADECQYLGIHPNKGKAQAQPPVTHSQVVHHTQPHIQEEVKAQTQHEFEQEAAHMALHAQSRKEYEEAKQLFKVNLEADVEDFKKMVGQNIKAWKDKYPNAQDHATLRREAHCFGYNIVPIDKGSTLAEKATFKKYGLAPLKVDGYTLLSSPPSRAPSPSPVQQPTTPPNTPLPLFLTDLNITLTPVCIKCIQSEDLPPSSPITYPHPQHAKPNAKCTLIYAIPPCSANVPLPLPTLMEEDFNYALEVMADCTVANNSSLEAAGPSTKLSGIQSVPPAAAPLDTLTQLIGSLQVTISCLEVKVNMSMVQLNKRIDTLSTSRDLQQKPAKAPTHYLTTDAKGKPTPSAIMPMSWAKVVTQKGNQQQTDAATLAKATTQGTSRNAQGGGLTLGWQGRPPWQTLVQEQGQMHPQLCLQIQGPSPLQDHLPPTPHPRQTAPDRTVHLVPMNGWIHAQLRDMIISDSNGVVFTGDQLEVELHRNTVFEKAIFCFAPHWQGNLQNVTQKPRSTVKIAYVDKTGSLTATICQDGVFLFNKKAHFIVTGDTPAIDTRQTLQPAPSQQTQSGVSCVEELTTPTTMQHTAQTNTTLLAPADATSHA
ncbi:hypothetical protein EDB86DRAFT_2830873 [Lactarius hatsudake]|nr:hypothetical protein EDB86DRAFT_2830873 [Lactarius hatsudake]